MRIVFILFFLFLLNCNKMISQNPKDLVVAFLDNSQGTQLIENYCAVQLKSPFKSEELSIFELNDGRAVLKILDYNTINNKYNLFASLSDLYSYLELVFNLEEDSIEFSFDYPIDFCSNNEFYINEFMKLYGKELEFHILSDLQLVDQYLNRSLNSDVFAEDIFVCLTAVVGEFIKCNVNGLTWTFLAYDDDESNYPVLVTKSGKIYQPSIIVYKELFEYFVEEGEVAFFEHVKIELIDVSKIVKP